MNWNEIELVLRNLEQRVKTTKIERDALLQVYRLIEREKK